MNVFARTLKDIRIQKSELTNTPMPKGAVSIWRDGRTSAEMRKLLTESFKKYSTIATRGRTEIIVWSGKKATDADALTTEVKNNLVISGWRISGEKQFRNYTELIIAKEHRVLSAFILPIDKVYIFALSELLMFDKPAQSDSP